MSFLSDFVSLFGTVYHVLLELPLLGVGILVGGFGYRFLQSKYPSLLSSAITDVGTQISSLEAGAQKIAAAAATTSSAASSLPSTYGSSK
jgi:hypothetical protein